MNKSGNVEKPISNAGATLCKYAMMKAIERSTDVDEDHARLNPTELVENEEDNQRLKQLAQWTSDPLGLMNNEKEDLNKGLLKYKQEAPGLSNLSKEISNFKRKIQKRANKFEVVVIPVDDKPNLVITKEKSDQLNMTAKSPKKSSTPSKSKIQSIILLDTESQNEVAGINQPSPQSGDGQGETENQNPNLRNSPITQLKKVTTESSPVFIQPKSRHFREKKLFFADIVGDKLAKFNGENGEKQPTLDEISKNRQNFKSNPDFHFNKE